MEFNEEFLERSGDFSGLLLTASTSKKEGHFDL